jgi:hypothetical protein
MHTDHPIQKQRRYQFSLANLFWVTTEIALYLGIGLIVSQIDIDLTIPIPPKIAVAMPTVAIACASAMVVVLVTGLFLAHREARGIAHRVRYGALFGACLATLLFGWTAVNLPPDRTGINPYAALAAVVVLGALLGSLAGLAAPRLKRMLEK